MSLSSEFVASGPLPSATFAGWDAQTNQVPLWADAAGGGGGGGGSADGPAGAVQYSDGAGNFQGSANCVVDATGNLYADASVESGGTLVSAGGLVVGAGATITGEIIGGANVTQTDTNAIATLSLVKARSLSLLLPTGAGSSLLNPVRANTYKLREAGFLTNVNKPLNNSTFTSSPTLVPAQGGWVVPAYGFGGAGTNTNPSLISGQMVLYNPDWNTDRDMLVMTSCSAVVGPGPPDAVFRYGSIVFNIVKDPNGTANGFLVNFFSANGPPNSGGFVGYTGADWTSINGYVPTGGPAGGAYAWPYWAWDGSTAVGYPATNVCCPIFSFRIIKGHT